VKFYFILYHNIIFLSILKKLIKKIFNDVYYNISISVSMSQSSFPTDTEARMKYIKNLFRFVGASRYVPRKTYMAYNNETHLGIDALGLDALGLSPLPWSNLTSTLPGQEFVFDVRALPDTKEWVHVIRTV
jgi:hypothetical protein